jgi:nucleotide-binding universal stress UspA family protein
MRYLAATDGQGANEALRDYLEPRLNPEDTVFAVQSLKGQEKDAGMGEDESDVVMESRETLEALEDQLGEYAAVETHQLVRGNDPHEDILRAADEYDADEILIGIRQRSAAERTLFGSNAQKVLMNADRPVVGLPLGE